MEPVRAQVAVLSVAGSSSSVTIENIVADSLTAAGHQITSFESVKDNEIAIRSQLVGWIEDPDIDLVLVIGDGAQTSKAMAPLVDQALPGFADLLRMLAFNEIGASAMLSTAEAAKCRSTFVFVLPSAEKAVSAAMDKLILPQLDPKTTPRNLISEMPRFKEEGDFTRVDTPSEPPPSPLDSIPVAIPKEKTASGAGMPARLPARHPDDNAKTAIAPAPEPPAQRSKQATQQRVKSATGKNVLVRSVEDPTKPIELQKLEQQIELSKNDGIKTKVDLSRLPAMPPGADASAALDGPGEDTVPGNLPPVAAKPPGTADKARPNTIAKPTAATPVAAKPALPLKPPSRETPAKPLPAVKSKPPPDAPSPVRAQAAKSEPIAIAKPKPAPSLIVVEEHEETPPPAPRPRPKTAPPSPPPKPHGVIQLPTDEIDPLDADEEMATMERARASVPQLSDSQIVLEEPDRPTLERLLPEEPPRPSRPPTPAPPVRPSTSPPPMTRPLTATGEKRPATAKPTAAALVDLPLPGNPELPAGNFDYKVTKSKAPLVIVGLLIVVALAVGGVILFKGRGGSDATRDAAEVAQNDKPDAAAVVEPPPPPPADAAEEIEMEPADAAVAAKPPTSGTKPPTKPPTTGTKPPATPTTPDKPPPEKPPTAPEKPPVTPDDPGCDEPTCVIEKYARPCCAKYKPTGDGFAPNSETLEKPQIRAGIDRVRPAISRCGEQHPAKGTVKVSVSVNPDGMVTSAEVVEAPEPALGKCVAGFVKKATFAKTTSGGTFSYPFVF